MKSQFQTVNSERAFFSFFSSYLTDIIQITNLIKSHTYQIIGIKSSTIKNVTVHQNIYSIMQGCNQSYQDLRRTQTLLKGHLKGIISMQKGRETNRESRYTVKNQIIQKNIPPLLSLKNKRQFNDSVKQLREKSNNIKDLIQINTIQQAKDQYFKLSYQRDLEKNNEKRMFESKSHGQLATVRNSSPPSDTFKNESIHFRHFGSMDIINKIRKELGIINT